MATYKKRHRPRTQKERHEHSQLKWFFSVVFFVVAAGVCASFKALDGLVGITTPGRRLAGDEDGGTCSGPVENYVVPTCTAQEFKAETIVTSGANDVLTGKPASCESRPILFIDSCFCPCNVSGDIAKCGITPNVNGDTCPHMFFIHLLVLMYMFLSIMIVCDELFVPALEIIADKWELSNDVAGATLMAAGGSAPELFTALMGVFQRGDLGFSTIVGSAVFNVLFVIGMCAMFTPEQFSPLDLTWWPLARDCSYYILTLLTLVLFMRDGKVEVYEALLQFLLYLGYVTLMRYSEDLEKLLKNWMEKKTNKVTVVPSGTTVQKEELDGLGEKAHKEFNRPSTFRAGVLQLLTSKKSVTDTAGIACVAKIKGDVYEVFDELDENKNGILDAVELKKLLTSLGVEEGELTEEKIKEHAKTIDSKNDGQISKSEFVLWYTASEERIMSEMKACFARFDLNKSNTIDQSEIRDLLRGMGHNPSDEEITEAEKNINQTEGELNFEDFSAWYKESLFWSEKRADGEEAAESQESVLQGIASGWVDFNSPDTPLRAKFFYLVSLPICCAYGITVPDCRPPGQEWKCFATFFMSIVGIGLSSKFMVDAAEELGQPYNLNIPTLIMGMTVIAAGTSVPDLISSVIVAKQGHGDMAVSSSVGSNIFDVTVGIPIPWLIFLLFTGARGCEFGVELNKNDLILPTLLLLIMVALIILSIAGSNWKMTHALGYMMFAAYFAYLGFAILNMYCFHISLVF